MALLALIAATYRYSHRTDTGRLTAALDYHRLFPHREARTSNAKIPRLESRENSRSDYDLEFPALCFK